MLGSDTLKMFFKIVNVYDGLPQKGSIWSQLDVIVKSIIKLIVKRSRSHPVLLDYSNYIRTRCIPVVAFNNLVEVYE